MRVEVDWIKPEPGSTVWRGQGRLEDGTKIIFAGDWRPMAALGEALRESGDEPIFAEVDVYAVLHVEYPKVVNA